MKMWNKQLLGEMPREGIHRQQGKEIPDCFLEEREV